MLLKVKNDCHCDWETALAWVSSAKNCLINVNGFSPHQIVFGKNITIPSIFTDQPSADLPENEIIIKHLNTLHATRQVFITAESSRKLKLALRKQTRNTRGFLKLMQKFTLNEIPITNGVVLVPLSDRAAQLFILDKVEYCTKLIAHAQNSLLISNIYQFGTINLTANNDNLQTGKTLQKTNPNTVNCDSDDKMYHQQTCESNEIVHENINATARNTNFIGKNQE